MPRKKKVVIELADVAVIDIFDTVDKMKETPGVIVDGTLIIAIRLSDGNMHYLRYDMSDLPVYLKIKRRYNINSKTVTEMLPEGKTHQEQQQEQQKETINDNNDDKTTIKAKKVS